MNRPLTLGVWLAGTLALTGCLVLPIPASGKKVIEGRGIHTNDLRFIQTGKTTRWELTQQIGVPGEFFDQMKVAAYTWRTASFYLVYGATSPGVTLGDVTTFGKNHTLLVQFDARDCVVRHEFVRRPRAATLRTLALQWSGCSESEGIVPLKDVLPAVPLDQSLLVIYRTGQEMDAWKLMPKVLIDAEEAADFHRHDHVWMVLPKGLYTVSVESDRLPESASFSPTDPSASFDLAGGPPSLLLELLPGQTHCVEVKLVQDAAPPGVVLQIREGFNAPILAR